LKGNAPNQSQLYIETDKVSLENVEALIDILKAAFGDPDEVGMASTALDQLTQGNGEFSIYYAEFQRLMAILEYDSKTKKAALKWGLSRELQSSFVYQTDEPKDFLKFPELCMQLDYHIGTHATLCKRPNNPSIAKMVPSSP
jgi:hypothetical protein